MSTFRSTEPVQLGAETLATLQPMSFAAGTLLFSPGELDDKLYIILSGEIALIADPGTAHERVVAMRVAGDQIGERSVFEQGSIHGLAGRVFVDTEMLILDCDDTDAVLRREPLLAYRLIAIASGFLHMAHEHARHVLEKKNRELAAAYASLEEVQAQLLVQERLQHELRLARDIQVRMLPTELPGTPMIEIGARIIPAYEVSGDFYDVFILDENTIGFVIADVCGKGMPAALYMVQTRTLIRAHAIASATPESVLLHVNAHLHELYNGDMFVTVVYGVLHRPSRSLVMARAGHDYPLLWTQSDVAWAGVPATGQPLGLLEQPTLDVQMWSLTDDDVLLLYTDGVTEAQCSDGGYFGSELLSATLAQSHNLSADAICSTIIATVADFQGSAAQHDDITLLVFKMV